jgi:hypothetical protein
VAFEPEKTSVLLHAAHFADILKAPEQNNLPPMEAKKMKPRLSTRIACVAGGMLAASATLLAGGPTIDGRNIPSDFAGAPTVVNQRFQTQFGNCNGSFFCGGSELDKMFVMNDAANLYIGLAGNLENNGNSIVIFIDVDGNAGGANPLKTRTLLAPQAIGFLPRYLTGNQGNGGAPFGLGLHDLPFDAGFFPDYCLGISGGSPRGSQSRTYYLANWTALAPDANTPANLSNDVAGMITTGDEFASGATAGTLGSFLQTSSLGILAAADNGNADGVGGGTIAIDCPNTPVLPDDPNTVTLGFEFAVPLALLGVGEDDDVCILAMVSSPDGYMSNQLLPTADATQCTPLANLGPVPGTGGGLPVDLADMPGDQFVCHTITAAGGPCGAACNVPGGDADVNDDCVVNITDLGILLAHFGSPGGHADGDTNGDGTINITDLGNLLSLFGTACP